LTPQTANSPRVDSLQEGRTRGLLLGVTDRRAVDQVTN
jgi:hypothetical protein